MACPRTQDSDANRPIHPTAGSVPGSRSFWWVKHKNTPTKKELHLSTSRLGHTPVAIALPQ
jgi:hypothetical protein